MVGGRRWDSGIVGRLREQWSEGEGGTVGLWVDLGNSGQREKVG